MKNKVIFPRQPKPINSRELRIGDYCTDSITRPDTAYLVCGVESGYVQAINLMSGAERHISIDTSVYRVSVEIKVFYEVEENDQ